MTTEILRVFVDRAANAMAAMGAGVWWFKNDPPTSCSAALRSLHGVTDEDFPRVQDVRARLRHYRKKPRPTIVANVDAADLKASGFPFAADISPSPTYRAEVGPIDVHCDALADAVPHRSASGQAQDVERNRRRAIIADVVRAAANAAAAV